MKAFVVFTIVLVSSVAAVTEKEIQDMKKELKQELSKMEGETDNNKKNKDEKKSVSQDPRYKDMLEDLLELDVQKSLKGLKTANADRAAIDFLKMLIKEDQKSEQKSEVETAFQSLLLDESLKKKELIKKGRVFMMLITRPQLTLQIMQNKCPGILTVVKTIVQIAGVSKLYVARKSMRNISNSAVPKLANSVDRGPLQPAPGKNSVVVGIIQPRKPIPQEQTVLVNKCEDKYTGLCKNFQGLCAKKKRFEAVMFVRKYCPQTYSVTFACVNNMGDAFCKKAKLNQYCQVLDVATRYCTKSCSDKCN
eukprot:gene9778-10777_t